MIERDYDLVEQREGLGELPSDRSESTGAFVRPAAIATYMAPVGPRTWDLRRVALMPGEAAPAQDGVDALIAKLRGTATTVVPPAYACPPIFAREAGPRSAVLAVAPGLTVILNVAGQPHLFRAQDRESFRFAGLYQFVSDPIAAADSTWRVFVNGFLWQIVNGLRSLAGRSIAAPLFVHGRGGSVVTVSVTNASAAPFDASVELEGWSYPPLDDVPGIAGTVST